MLGRYKNCRRFKTIIVFLMLTMIGCGLDLKIKGDKTTPDVDNNAEIEDEKDSGNVDREPAEDKYDYEDPYENDSSDEFIEDNSDEKLLDLTQIQGLAIIEEPLVATATENLNRDEREAVATRQVLNAIDGKGDLMKLDDYLPAKLLNNVESMIKVGDYGMVFVVKEQRIFDFVWTNLVWLKKDGTISPLIPDLMLSSSFVIRKPVYSNDGKLWFRNSDHVTSNDRGTLWNFDFKEERFTRLTSKEQEIKDFFATKNGDIFIDGETTSTDNDFFRWLRPDGGMENVSRLDDGVHVYGNKLITGTLQYEVVDGKLIKSKSPITVIPYYNSYYDKPKALDNGWMIASERNFYYYDRIFDLIDVKDFNPIQNPQLTEDSSVDKANGVYFDGTNLVQIEFTGKSIHGSMFKRIKFNGPSYQVEGVFGRDQGFSEGYLLVLKGGYEEYYLGKLDFDQNAYVKDIKELKSNRPGKFFTYNNRLFSVGEEGVQLVKEEAGVYVLESFVDLEYTLSKPLLQNGKLISLGKDDYKPIYDQFSVDLETGEVETTSIDVNQWTVEQGTVEQGSEAFKKMLNCDKITYEDHFVSNEGKGYLIAKTYFCSEDKDGFRFVVPYKDAEFKSVDIEGVHEIEFGEFKNKQLFTDKSGNQYYINDRLFMPFKDGSFNKNDYIANVAFQAEGYFRYDMHKTFVKMGLVLPWGSHSYIFNGKLYGGKWATRVLNVETREDFEIPELADIEVVKVLNTTDGNVYLRGFSVEKNQTVSYLFSQGGVLIKSNARSEKQYIEMVRF